MKKQVVLLSLESVYGRLILSRLLQMTNIEIKAVVLSKVVYGKSTSMFAVRKIIKKSGIGYLFYLLKTSTPICSSYYPEYKTSIEKICKKNGIKVYHTGNINSKEGVEFINRINPDILLSFYFNQIIKENLIKLPPKIVNIHPSSLPKYRGLEPVMQALLHNEKEIGVSLHSIDVEVDTGNILSSDKCNINGFTTFYSLTKEVLLRGLNLFENYVKTDLSEEGESQKESNKASYFSWPTKSDIKKLKKMEIQFK